MTTPTGTTRPTRFPAWRHVRVALVALLPLIAFWVAFEGERYDPARQGLGPKDGGARKSGARKSNAAGATAPTSSSSPSALPSPAAAAGSQTEPTPGPAVPPVEGPISAAPAAPAAKQIPETLLPPMAATADYQPKGPIEHFNRETLYEKINGAAPDYLERGFRFLMARNFAPRDPEAYGCELSIYDMGSPDGARKIFERERGEGLEAVTVGEAGYRTGASWYFYQAHYYVIILNTDEGAAAEAFSRMLATQVSTRIQAQKKP